MHHNENLKLICSTFLFELSKFIRLVRGNHTVRATNVVRGNRHQKLVEDTKWRHKMVYTAFAWKISWKGYDFLQK